jgi:hypothetical protein
MEKNRVQGRMPPSTFLEQSRSNVLVLNTAVLIRGDGGSFDPLTKAYLHREHATNLRYCGIGIRQAYYIMVGIRDRVSIVLGASGDTVPR